MFLLIGNYWLIIGGDVSVGVLIEEKNTKKKLNKT